MKNLLTLNYWFDLRPETLIPYAQKAFIGLIALFIILAIFVIIIKKRGGIYRGFLKRLYSFFWSNAIIGLVLFFFNYEMVPFFSARFWLGLWLIMMAIWIFFILKKLKTIPQQKRQLEQEKKLKKYIP